MNGSKTSLLLAWAKSLLVLGWLVLLVACSSGTGGENKDLVEVNGMDAPDSMEVEVEVPECGNGVCEMALGEKSCTCPQDCTLCGGCCDDDTCRAGTGHTMCGREGQVCEVCVAQEKSCIDQECQFLCGDALCGAEEDCSNCSVDCSCVACGEECVMGLCTFLACNARECGDDGCGGSCGICSSGEACQDGQCIEPTWTDSTSSLTWQVMPTGGFMNWSNAKTHCSDLDLDGGGWRLPSIDELRTLIRGCPATEDGGSCNVEEGGCLRWSCRDETCDGCSGGDGPASGCYWPDNLQGGCTWYWSSSPVEDGDGVAWGVNFVFGHVYTNLILDVPSVRCVR